MYSKQKFLKTLFHSEYQNVATLTRENFHSSHHSFIFGCVNVYNRNT